MSFNVRNRLEKVMLTMCVCASFGGKDRFMIGERSMSSSQNSLSDQRRCAWKLGCRNGDKRQYLGGSQGDINLRNMCPNHRGGGNRVCWLEEILRRFEVEVIEQYDRDGIPGSQRFFVVWLSEINTCETLVSTRTRHGLRGSSISINGEKNERLIGVGFGNLAISLLHTKSPDSSASCSRVSYR